jgi:L-galactose dehydrogenase
VQVDTILSHNHYSLNDTLLLDLLPLIKATGVGLINASPLSSGLLTNRGPSSWHPATIEDKQVCQQAVAFCEQQGVSIEKLAVQFSSSHPDIPTTLVSTSRCEIITNNVRWVEEPLDLGLVWEVQAILAPIMNKDWNFGNLNWN